MRFRNPASEKDREKKTDYSEDRRFGDFPSSKPIHVKAHKKRQRNRKSNGKGSPWRFGKRIYHNKAEPRQCNYNDEQNCNSRDSTGKRTDLGAGNFRQGLAVSSHARPEDHEIVNSSAKTDADHKPEQAGKKPKLSSKNRPNKRASAGNCGEMMTK